MEEMELWSFGSMRLTHITDWLDICLKEWWVARVSYSMYIVCDKPA